MQVTSTLKLVEKQLHRKQYAPKLRFYFKHFRMTIKPLKIAAKIIFIFRKINLNIQNLKIIPYNQKETKQIQPGALFLQFSVWWSCDVYSNAFNKCVPKVSAYAVKKKKTSLFRWLFVRP